MFVEGGEGGGGEAMDLGVGRMNPVVWGGGERFVFGGGCWVVEEEVRGSRNTRDSVVI